MMRTLALSALLALVAAVVLCIGIGAVGSVPLLADEVRKGVDDAPKEDADPQDEKEDKKVDKYLGIDWGDDKDKKDEKEDPDAKDPAQKVNLDEALDKPQLSRLERIKRDAEKAAEAKAKADKVYNGQDKRLKKPDSVRLFDNVGTLYKARTLDVERLARMVKDEDARLTLLREYHDAYRNEACAAYCKAAQTIIETATSFPALKQAGIYLKKARLVNPKYPGIAEVVAMGRERAREMLTKVEEAEQRRTSSGGEKEKDDHYDDVREDRDYKETGREDYKKTGR